MIVNSKKKIIAVDVSSMSFESESCLFFSRYVYLLINCLLFVLAEKHHKALPSSSAIVTAQPHRRNSHSCMLNNSAS